MRCRAKRSLSVCLWRWWIMSDETEARRTTHRLSNSVHVCSLGATPRTKSEGKKAPKKPKKHETCDMSRDCPNHPRCRSATCRCVSKHVLTHFIFGWIIQNNHDAYKWKEILKKNLAMYNHTKQVHNQQYCSVCCHIFYIIFLWLIVKFHLSLVKFTLSIMFYCFVLYIVL